VSGGDGQGVVGLKKYEGQQCTVFITALDFTGNRMGKLRGERDLVTDRKMTDRFLTRGSEKLD
jgi:hypothetical protein